MYVAYAADVEPASLFEMLKVSRVFSAFSPMNETYGLFAGTRTCSLYGPGAIRITQRDVLFAGTFSIAWETVRTSPPPSADTRISQVFPAANAFTAARRARVEMYKDLNI